MRKCLLLNFCVTFLFLLIPISELSACETTEATVVGLLNSSSSIVSAPVSPVTFAEIESAADLNETINVFDGRGISHEVRIYWFHTGNQTWLVRFYVDGGEIGLVNGVPGLVGETILTFNQSGAQIAEQQAFLTPTWSNGASAQTIAVAMSGFFELATTSRVSFRTQDGSASGCSRRTGADYDGDGEDDFTIFRPAIGFWAILKSSSNYTDLIFKQWGLSGDTPMVGDYTGDGRADLVVWRPSDGNWYICRSEISFDCTNPLISQFGLPGDRPIQADYDDDGILDLAIWRPEFGLFIFRSSTNGQIVLRQWGLPLDIPLFTGSRQ